jgi:hypothetical protein
LIASSYNTLATLPSATPLMAVWLGSAQMRRLLLRHDSSPPSRGNSS